MSLTHFIDITEFSKETLLDILESALQLKSNVRLKKETDPVLQGKTVGLLFEKPSTRTRVSFEVGIRQLGGQAITLYKHEVGLGKREPIKDVARTLSRYLDMVMIRTFEHDNITTFASHATIPVINGLTDHSHPCQALADFMTIKENFSDLFQLKIAYLGDGNNVCRSLVNMAQVLGVDIVISNPPSFELTTDRPVTRVSDPKIAVAGAHVVYTDTWISMGEGTTHKPDRLLSRFLPYQVTAELMALANPSAIFMHCLPAHRGEEVTDDVIEAPYSKVFDQAENRLHAQKAVMRYLVAS